MEIGHAPRGRRRQRENFKLKGLAVSSKRKWGAFGGMNTGFSGKKQREEKKGGSWGRTNIVVGGKRGSTL